MRKIYALFILIALSLSAEKTNAQCAATFTVDTTQSIPAIFGVDFWADYNVNLPHTYYNWSFPGAVSVFPYNGYGRDSIRVLYYANGTYNACLELYDTLTNCSDSLCDTISIAYLPLIPVSYNGWTPVNTTCGQCNGSAVANIYGGTLPISYLWSNGATVANPTGLCPGTYTYTATDANNYTVVDTVVILSGSNYSLNVNLSLDTASTCDSATVYSSVTGGTTPYNYLWNNGWSANFAGYSSSSGWNWGVVTVTDANGCMGVDSINLNFSSFSLNISKTDETCSSCCDGTVSASTSGGTGGQAFTYLWSNGATSATQIGLCPGYYSLTVTDTINYCSKTQSVLVTTYSCDILSGLIVQGPPAKVYLIEENAGFLTAVDSISIDTGSYYFFDSVCPGTYYVKAALLPTHSSYGFFTPTYYVNSSLWGTATAIMVSGYTSNIDVNLLSGANLGGPGFIGGLVSQGANRGEGDPIVGIQVNLLDENDNFLAFTYTDANGEYEFTGLTYGSYKVYVELMNFEPFPFVVNVNAENENVENRNFVVEGGLIKPVTPTGISANTIEGIAIYPNPANDQITIRGKVDKIEIYNTLGKVVLVSKNLASEHNNVDIDELKSGVYFIKLISGNKEIQKKLIVK